MRFGAKEGAGVVIYPNRRIVYKIIKAAFVLAIGFVVAQKPLKLWQQGAYPFVTLMQLAKKQRVLN